MKKVSLTITALAMMLVITAYAKENDDKVVEKARNAVENASPDDWYAYAKSAEMCIRKNVNMKEASEWIDKSISIKETAYNLEVKGDYYAKNQLPEKALEMYVRSAQIARESDINADTSGLQEKIAKLKS